MSHTSRGHYKAIQQQDLHVWASPLIIAIYQFSAAILLSLLVVEKVKQTLEEIESSILSFKEKQRLS